MTDKTITNLTVTIPYQVVINITNTGYTASIDMNGTKIIAKGKDIKELKENLTENIRMSLVNIMADTLILDVHRILINYEI